MGRIFETRKATMMARWDRMSKAFTRCAKDIAIAVKAGGPAVENNPGLRRAIQNARAVNMPKDKIENAIKRAMGGDAETYSEVVYEGFAPHGVPMMVECATDNPTRTISNVRLHFNKGGGTLGASGSTGYLFTRMGVFRVKPEGIDADELELDLIDYGLEEMGESTTDDGEPVLVIRCAFTEFGAMADALEARGITPLSSGPEYIAMSPLELTDEQAAEVLALVDRLEQDDDVQKVFYALA